MAAERQPPPPHTIRVALSGHCEQSPWAHVFWCFNSQSTVPSNPADLSNFAQGFYGHWRDTVFESLSNQCHLESCKVLYQEPSGDVLGGEFVGSDSGDAGGAPLPANVAVVISWLIQQRYRGGHPRTYLPGIPDGAQTDNTTIGDVFRLPVQNSANNFISRINGYSGGAIAGVQLGTVSFRFRKAWRDFPVFRAYTPGGATVDNRLDSQRRRLGADR